MNSVSRWQLQDLIAIQAILLVGIRAIAVPGVFRLVELGTLCAILGWWRWRQSFSQWNLRDLLASQAIMLLVVRIVAFPSVFRLVEVSSVLVVLGWWRLGKTFVEQVGLFLLALALAWGIPVTVISLLMNVFYW